MFNTLRAQGPAHHLRLAGARRQLPGAAVRQPGLVRAVRPAVRVRHGDGADRRADADARPHALDAAGDPVGSAAPPDGPPTVVRHGAAASRACRDGTRARSCCSAGSRRRRPGPLVLRKGETATRCTWSSPGACACSIAGPTDARRVLTELTPGAVFGEMALVTGEVRSAFVVAVPPTRRCCASTSRRSSASAAGFPFTGAKLFRNLARVLADRLRKTTDALVTDEAPAAALRRSARRPAAPSDAMPFAARLAHFLRLLCRIGRCRRGRGRGSRSGSALCAALQWAVRPRRAALRRGDGRDRGGRGPRTRSSSSDTGGAAPPILHYLLALDREGFAYPTQHTSVCIPRPSS